MTDLLTTNKEMDLIKVKTNKSGERVVSGRRLYEFLQIKTPYTQWFDRMLKYGFEDGVDYFPVSQKSESGGASGVKIIQDHIITLDMAKELCMIQRSDIGRQARRYFIQIEKAYKHLTLARELGKEARKSLTDVIDDVTPDSPDKHWVYKNFTDLIYKSIFNMTAQQMKKSLGLKKKDNLRDFLSDEDLERIQNCEELVKSFLKMGKNFKQISAILRSDLLTN